MRALLIREVSEKLRRQLKAASLRHRRSMAKEALALLEAGLEQEQRSGSLRAKKLPKPFKGRFPLTDEFIVRSRREGRM